MDVYFVIEELKLLSTPEHFSKLKHFGINDSKALGVKVPLLRELAKTIGKNHSLALDLWKTEIHEARILASMIASTTELTENQFDDWVKDFDSWDVCDSTCDLLARTPFVRSKIEEYSTHNEEFVKRTAFTLMCELAFHDKKATNESYFHFFEIIEREAWDNRNFVRKAVNWALRQIGKRNELLRLMAIDTAERIMKQDSKSARWIATDALRELNNEKIIARVNRARKTGL
jgi:3-methyladenine DNA glycosylase AlkD